MSNETALTIKQRVEGFMSLVAKKLTNFAQLLPKGMEPKWFEAEVRVAIARAPKLMECDDVSVFDALTTCAQLGLSPSGRLGSAYLIPYGKKCQLVVGYRGLIDLAYRSGEIVELGAQVVHEHDVFDLAEGFGGASIRHIRTESDPGRLRAVYAWATTRGGGMLKIVMLRREVEPIRQASLAKARGGPWLEHEAEMWKKTALRRLLKVAPLSPEKAKGLARALESEDAEWEEVDSSPGLRKPTMPGGRASADELEDAVFVEPEARTDDIPRMTMEEAFNAPAGSFPRGEAVITDLPPREPGSDDGEEVDPMMREVEEIEALAGKVETAEEYAKIARRGAALPSGTEERTRASRALQKAHARLNLPKTGGGAQ